MSSFAYTQKELESNLLPEKTYAKAKVIVIPGNHSDPEKGIFDGWATESPYTGSVYYNTYFEVLDTFSMVYDKMTNKAELQHLGKYKNMRIYHMIGIESSKGPEWGYYGTKFIKDIIHSGRNIMPKDMSEEAEAKREMKGRCAAEDIHEQVVAITTGIKPGQTAADPSYTTVKKILVPGDTFYNIVMGLEGVPQKRHNEVIFDDDIPF